MWYLYHLMEVTFLPILVILIKPTDKFDVVVDQWFDGIALVVVAMFVLGGIRRLRNKGRENQVLIVTCKRKHLLTKCMYLALLIRVTMLIDQLMPEGKKVRDNYEGFLRDLTTQLGDAEAKSNTVRIVENNNS
jgi:hypothetical protein